jgi:hypothetical protein
MRTRGVFFCPNRGLGGAEMKLRAKASRSVVDNHFAEAGNMVKIAIGAQGETADYHLSLAAFLAIRLIRV